MFGTNMPVLLQVGYLVLDMGTDNVLVHSRRSRSDLDPNGKLFYEILLEGNGGLGDKKISLSKGPEGFQYMRRKVGEIF